MFPLCLSVGCPRRCSFCINSSKKEPWKAIDVTHAVDVLEFLHLEHGISFFPLADANFGVGHDWWRAFFSSLRDRPWSRHVRFAAETAVTSIPLREAEMLDGLSISFHIGVESCSAEMLARMKKTGSPKKYLARLKEIMALYGRCVDSLQLMLVLGYPGESRRTLKETFQYLIDDCGVLEYPSVALLAQLFLPLQGTVASENLENYQAELGFQSGLLPWWEGDVADRYEGLRPSRDLAAEDCVAVINCLDGYYGRHRGVEYSAGSPPWTRLGRTQFRRRLFDLLG
jgi:radical SAM superfamily enzyme YgiQ (UPF0313 family)